jgi:hypothetical protein
MVYGSAIHSSLLQYGNKYDHKKFSDYRYYLHRRSWYSHEGIAALAIFTRYFRAKLAKWPKIVAEACLHLVPEW